MTKHRLGLLFVAAAVLFLSSTPSASAHPGHGGGFGDGLAHAFTGLDHLLAMFAVGLLAVRVGGRGLWLVPAAFLGSMFVGGLAAAAGLQLPGAEIGVLASVLAFGALLATTRAASLVWGVTLVALFASFHGFVHIQEMSASDKLLPFAAGMLLSTAGLHAMGIGAALLLKQLWRADAVRYVGAAIAACGVVLLASWI